MQLLSFLACRRSWSYLLFFGFSDDSASGELGCPVALGTPKWIYSSDSYAAEVRSQLESLLSKTTAPVLCMPLISPAALKTPVTSGLLYVMIRSPLFGFRLFSFCELGCPVAL